MLLTMASLTAFMSDNSQLHFVLFMSITAADCMPTHLLIEPYATETTIGTWIWISMQASGRLVMNARPLLFSYYRFFLTRSFYFRFDPAAYSAVCQKHERQTNTQSAGHTKTS